MHSGVRLYKPCTINYIYHRGSKSPVKVKKDLRDDQEKWAILTDAVQASAILKQLQAAA